MGNGSRAPVMADRTRLAVSPAALLDLLDAVERDGAVYLVTRAGRPVAVVCPVEAYARVADCGAR